MQLAVVTLFFRRLPLLIGLGLLTLGMPSLPSAQGEAPAATVTESTTAAMRRSALVVTNTADAGEGSLRQAIVEANARDGPDSIRFDSTGGPFATPQMITLASELPDLVGELTIDGYIEGRLWKPSGVTVSGGNARRVFSVAPGATVTISSLTIAEGRATQGGGIANQGGLVVKGVTFKDNVASRDDGGGLANLGGTLTVINSTFVGNQAGKAGGGLADHTGTVTVTNCTFSNNGAPKGGGLFSAGTLLLRNTILANSEGGDDCAAAGALDPASTHNLIEANAGCGTPISTADPRFEQLGGYNGPTPTLPLGGGSPAVNLGDNASAVDEDGEPLRWDQRGNGDPRFVAGITDIGAFEVQAFPKLVVDTVEDTDLRGCRGGRPDCSLRGAIALANATPKADVIRFDTKVFSEPRTITPTQPLPEVTADLTLDARGTGGVTLRGKFTVLRAAPDARLTLYEVVLEP
jgi:predicted outer membrane repeat protein